jgi:hypothetical protein
LQKGPDPLRVVSNLLKDKGDELWAGGKKTEDILPKTSPFAVIKVGVDWKKKRLENALTLENVVQGSTRPVFSELPLWPGRCPTD